MQYTIHRFDTIDSTNTTAIKLAEDGAPEGTVIIAAEQTAGRGRRGKNWSSPSGDGLYMSLILRPNKPFDQLWQLAFVASVAVAEGIHKAANLPAQIKWPNDILINERKICGILIETRTQPISQNGPLQDHSCSEGRGRLRPPPRPPLCPTACLPVIAGIGVNVNTEDFPKELADKATSIFLELGTRIEIPTVESALLNAFALRYEQYLREGFPTILKSWRLLDCTTNRRIKVETHEGTIEGTATGVDETGDLLVKQVDGSQTRISSGEVILSSSG